MAIQWYDYVRNERTTILRARHRGYLLEAGDSGYGVVGYRIYNDAGTVALANGLASVEAAQVAAIAAADSLLDGDEGVTHE